MIRAQYRDAIIDGQLYCTLQVQRDMGVNTHAMLYMSRWFGSAELLPPAGRGELLTLAATTGTYRHEMLLISPSLSHAPDKVLQEWRNKFQRIEYCDCELYVTELLTAECRILAASNERAVVHDFIVADFLNNIGSRADALFRLGTSLGDVYNSDYVYAITDSSSKVIGFRKAFSIEHLREILKIVNAHDLLVYCSPYRIDGKNVVAIGPWVMIPPQVHNECHQQLPPLVVTTDVVTTDVVTTDVVTTDVVTTPFDDTNDSITTLDVIENAVPDWDCIVETKDGKLICPYCQRELKNKAGMTNHVRSVHPDNFDDYKSRC